MILKGSQRANGADLAIHLMNGFDNERIEVAQVTGTVADDLMGAFAEMEIVAQGTRAKNYLYSLSINPSAPLTREQYFECIETIEDRLGLAGQPRAVVFHVKADKHGVPREHCHVVWSKIDAASMKAIHMAYDHAKLCDLACELAHKYDLDLPPGLKNWEEKNRKFDDKLEPTLGEKAQAESTGITPEQRREEITACYERADSPEALRAALEDKGYVLARGDKRGFVVVDKFGNPHSLTRYLKGHKAKDIRARLAPLSPDDLPSVDEAKEMMRQRAQAQKESQGGGDEGAHLEAQAALEHAALAKRHEEQRTQIRIKKQELLTRQQSEALSLHAAQETESRGLIFRVRSAVADLIGKTLALRSVLGPIQKLTHLDPKERHALEREALARRHSRERLEIARLNRAQARLETREKAALEMKLRKAARLARGLETKVRRDFHEAGRDRMVRKQTESGARDLSVKFNDAGEFAEGPPPDADDDGEGRRPSWKQRAEDLRQTKESRRSLNPRRGKGYGLRRDE